MIGSKFPTDATRLTNGLFERQRCDKSPSEVRFVVATIVIVSVLFVIVKILSLVIIVVFVVKLVIVILFNSFLLVLLYELSDKRTYSK